MPITDDLLQVIHQTAASIPTFHDKLGPGAEKGNGATSRFVHAIKEIVRDRWPDQVEINRIALWAFALGMWAEILDPKHQKMTSILEGESGWSDQISPAKVGSDIPLAPPKD